MEKTNNHWFYSWTIFLTGITISLILRLLFPEIYHHFDVHTFEEWIPYVKDLKQVYTTSCYCNYPVLGLLLSSGIMHLLGGVSSFLIFLAIIDGLNVFLIYKLFSNLKVANAMIWAGITGLLPSTFIGGALWGQIDTIGQSELFIFLILVVAHLKTNSLKLRLSSSIGIGILLSIALLTKQLLLFPVLILGFLMILYWMRDYRKYLTSMMFALITFLLPIVTVDLWLTLPESYHISHFQKIFLEGSEHVNFISGNGFNVWMLFVDEMYTPSTTPWILGLSPKMMGILIVGILSIAIFFNFYKRFTKVEMNNVIGGMLLSYSLLFLAVNLFFTGTHERYLYHFYPILILSIFLLNLPKQVIWLTVAAATVYGLFVFGILKQYHHSQWFFSSYTAHRIVFVTHFLLFVYLLRIYLSQRHE